jgi:hypothetical protein
VLSGVAPIKPDTLLTSYLKNVRTFLELASTTSSNSISPDIAENLSFGKVIGVKSSQAVEKCQHYTNCHAEPWTDEDQARFGI